MTTEQHEQFHKEDHNKLAQLVVDIVDYGTKITELQTKVALLEEKNRELEKDRTNSNSWRMKLVGWGLTVAMAIGGAAMTTYSKTVSIEDRVKELGDDQDYYKNELRDLQTWVLDKFLSKEAYDREQKNK